MQDTRSSMLSEQHPSPFNTQRIMYNVNFDNLESLQDAWNKRHERVNRTAREQPLQLTSPRSQEVCKIYGNEERVSEVLRTSTHIHELNFNNTVHLLERKVKEEDKFVTNALKVFQNQGIWIGTRAEKLAAYIKFNEQEARRVPLLNKLREKWLHLVDEKNGSECINTLGTESIVKGNVVDDDKAKSNNNSSDVNNNSNSSADTEEWINDEYKNNLKENKESIMIALMEKDNSENSDGVEINEDMHSEQNTYVFEKCNRNTDAQESRVPIARSYQVSNGNKNLSAINQPVDCESLERRANENDYINNQTNGECNNKNEVEAIVQLEHPDVSVIAYSVNDVHKHVRKSKDMITEDDLFGRLHDKAEEKNNTKQNSTDRGICNVTKPMTSNVNDDSCSLRDERETTSIYYDTAAGDVTEFEAFRTPLLHQAPSPVKENNTAVSTWYQTVASKVEVGAKHDRVEKATDDNESNENKANSQRVSTLAEPSNTPRLSTPAITNAKAMPTIPFIDVADDVHGFFYYCANATWIDHFNTNETPVKKNVTSTHSERNATTSR